MTEDTDIIVEVEYPHQGKLRKERVKLEEITWRLHRKILSQHLRFQRGRFNVNGTEPKDATFRACAQRGMPTDIDSFHFTIVGEGIGKPGYAFQFIGAFTWGQSERPDAISPLPFVMNFIDNAGHKGTIILGFIWAVRVVMENQRSFCVEFYEPTSAEQPDDHSTHGDEQYHLNVHVYPTVPKDERATVIRKLAQGYDLMRELCEAIGPKRQSDNSIETRGHIAARSLARKGLPLSKQNMATEMKVSLATVKRVSRETWGKWAESYQNELSKTSGNVN